MLDSMMQKWKEIAFVFLVVATAFNFYSWRVEASDSKEKVDRMEQTFERIATIAEQLIDQKSLIRQYLEVKGKDSICIANWLNTPIGPIYDSVNNPIANIPFIENRDGLLPETGILKMYINDSTLIIIKILWNYK